MVDEHSAPQVTIVVLNWNGWPDTIRCLRALSALDYPRYAVVVVDNGSVDGSEERIRNAHPDVRLLQMGANVGFAAGNNAGIKLALDEDSSFVWVLNNDTVVPPGCLSSMVRVMLDEPRLAVLGPHVYHPETHQAEPINPFPPGTSRLTGDGLVQPVSSAGGLELMDTAPGCSMLIRSEVLQQLRGFDERYFHFFEDTDLCWRAWQSGWLVGRTDTCCIEHRYGSSTAGRRPLALYYMLRNILIFSSRTSGMSVAALMVRRPVLWLWALGPLLGIRSFARPGTKIAVLRALRDALLGREGRSTTYSPA